MHILKPPRMAAPFLNNGNGNRCCGTYALTHLAMPKQRTALFWRKHCSPFIKGEGKGVVVSLINALLDQRQVLFVLSFCIAPLLRAKARRGVLVFFRADKVAASYVKKFCNGYKRIKVRFAPAHFPIADTVGCYVEY